MKSFRFIIMIMVLMLGILAASCGQAETEEASEPVPGYRDTGESLYEEGDPITPYDPAKFNKVLDISGNGDSVSEDFYLGAGSKKITWEVTGDYYATIDVYLVLEGATVGKPIISLAKGSSEKFFEANQGYYHLDIVAPGASWHITIQQPL